MFLHNYPTEVTVLTLKSLMKPRYLLLSVSCLPAHHYLTTRHRCVGTLIGIQTLWTRKDAADFLFLFQALAECFFPDLNITPTLILPLKMKLVSRLLFLFFWSLVASGWQTVRGTNYVALSSLTNLTFPARRC